MKPFVIKRFDEIETELGPERLAEILVQLDLVFRTDENEPNASSRIQRLQSCRGPIPGNHSRLLRGVGALAKTDLSGPGDTASSFLKESSTGTALSDPSCKDLSGGWACW